MDRDWQFKLSETTLTHQEPWKLLNYTDFDYVVDYVRICLLSMVQKDRAHTCQQVNLLQMHWVRIE